MSTAERAENIFALLASERAAGPDLAIRESDVSLSGGRVSHALDADGRPAVLVPLAEGQASPEDSRTRGVTIRRRELLDRGKLRLFLVVRSEEATLDPQFALFADDLLAALTEHPEAPGTTCMAVLERWRELMAAPPLPLLSRSALAGLLAELHALEVLAARDPASALAAWCGPEGGRHDFANEHGAIEVKATTGREGFKVQIHGVMQLEYPEQGPLTLYAEQMEMVNQGGDSVPDAVDRVQSLGTPRQVLRDRLEAIGFRSSDADIYRAVRFSVLRRAIAEVDDAFPRIVRDSFTDPSLPDYATDISYSIDLSEWVQSADDLSYVETIVRALRERR
jgi:hypothetical protein